MNKLNIYYLFLRYFTLLILPISSLLIFYKIFTPLTIYPSFWIIKLFYFEAFLNIPDTINFAGESAKIISACVAGAAYYFLLILNLTTPMSFKTRIKSIIFLLMSFLILNILRIVIFAQLYVSGYSYFDLTHQLTWNFGSTILLIIIWFVNVKIFKIKNIPIYTDIKNILKEIKWS
ncbi:hypothetical protein COU54_04930 [Candidatus Pacearchaeota archaeon CG10_big_fil_rev_8_21_14_0_10_31_24]|nr:MAG: hypothetical protein COU54_04930 [Candidatus Pacearchaeota archaeon CG10_big_fil_rev_8_21_14_0_10_31_24]